MWKRIWTLFIARNREFYRDRSALAWNILFPFLVIIGFSVLFSEDRQVLYKVGILGPPAQEHLQGAGERILRDTKYIEVIHFVSREIAMDRLMHHRIDFLLEPDTGDYWVSSTSPKGYVVERLLLAGDSKCEAGFRRRSIEGIEIPYIEWLFPGILGMNIMFSSLFGVGYVVVRYRKNGMLKRMSVTPVKSHEFIAAQVLSRVFLILLTTVVVYAGTVAMFGFRCRGSYITLFLVFLLGGLSMILMGLLVASRSSSEEFAGGILNLISWPMMFLSEVWFSLEGARPWVRNLSNIFPLTHMIDSARRVMNDGAGIHEIGISLLVLTGMSLLFLALSSYLFKWKKD